MFSFESIKFFSVFVLLCAITSCGFRQTTENQNAGVSSAAFSAEESKSAVPFLSNEPNVYQAEIVLTTYANGEKSMRKIFSARNGAKLRCDFENGVSFLQTSENEKFSLDNGKKIYAETQSNFGVSDENSEPIKDFLTAEWLDEKRGAKFENLGSENDLTKYRVKFEDGTNTDASENLIYVDESLKFPVRQEFYTTNGEQKILVFSMELQNFKLEASDELFELPKDFQQVSINEFEKIIRQEKTKK